MGIRCNQKYCINHYSRCKRNYAMPLRKKNKQSPQQPSVFSIVNQHTHPHLAYLYTAIQADAVQAIAQYQPAPHPYQQANIQHKIADVFTRCFYNINAAFGRAIGGYAGA